MGPEILHFSQIPRWTDTGGRSKPLKHEQLPTPGHFPNTPLDRLYIHPTNPICY